MVPHCARWGCAPTRPAPPRLGSMPALPCTPRPPLSLLAWSSSGPLNQLCPLSCGGHTSPGGRVRAWPQAQLFQQGEVCWVGTSCPCWGKTHLEAGGPTLTARSPQAGGDLGCEGRPTPSPSLPA